MVAPEALVRKTNAKGTAKAALPMAKKGEISSPKVLAERIREVLKHDPTGNKKLVRGANTTPAGFLASVQAAGGAVSGVSALPMYLESLIERDMPPGKFTMSRVIYSVEKGTEKYALDIKKGFDREAHKGERGWYDANTGGLILAGDCSNSPLGLVTGPTAPQAPTKPAPSACPAKKIAISVWEAKASTFACAGPARVKELGDRSPFGSGHVSRECGPDFRRAFLKDDLKMVPSPTKLTMSHVRGGTVVRTLYDAVPPASEVRVGLPADFRPGDSIRIVPESHTGLWSPLIKPMQSAYWEFDHCVTLHSFVVK